MDIFYQTKVLKNENISKKYRYIFWFMMIYISAIHSIQKYYHEVFFMKKVSFLLMI